MRIEQRGGTSGPAMLPAPEPSRNAAGWQDPSPHVAFPGEGTGRDSGLSLSPGVTLWTGRWRKWRDAFEQRIGPAARRYWSLYRMWDSGQGPGPGQEWRDRTVIPECYKILETRLPRLVNPMFGTRDSIAVEGREGSDEEYEETVRTLLDQTLDNIGTGDESGNYHVRIIGGNRYCQIMGHVWWKVWWRREYDWLQTRIPIVGDDGKKTWEPVEVMEQLYDGVDLQWLGLGDLAVDVNSTSRRWSIERVMTTLKALEREDDRYHRAHGIHLYENLELLRQHSGAAGGPSGRESFEEPRDTERWPLTEAQAMGTEDPDDPSVELWLCWDNVQGTLRKIGNRSVSLAYGYAPTPDRRDPYIGQAAVPIPGRVYGESILHWVGPLAAYQTKLARARADEVMLNLWQQVIYREGAVVSSNMFWRPGGGMAIRGVPPERSIADSVTIYPRRPVFTEAWQEEGYRQQQAESAAAADPVSQGVEATQKSRDVSATEIQQRVLQGSARYQIETLYVESVFKIPLYRKVFNLLRQNMTQERTVRVLGKEKTVDLTALEIPVDFKVGSGLLQQARTDRLEQAKQMVELSKSPAFLPFLNEREVLLELFESWGTKNRSRFVRTEEEVRAKQQQMAGAPSGAPGAAGGMGGPPARPGAPPGAPGGTGPAGSAGESPTPAPVESERLLAEI